LALVNDALQLVRSDITLAVAVLFAMAEFVERSKGEFIGRGSTLTIGQFGFLKLGHPP
jgi:hypothetical protein